jgi:hypothetical protein
MSWLLAATAEPGAGMTEIVDGTSGSVSRRRVGLGPTVRLLSATIIIGIATGAVIGGLGGRLAMRILLLTSDDAVKGLTSDDGFEIGRFTLGDTAGLVVVTSVIGVIAALLFLVAWPFVSRFGRTTVPMMAALYGVVGGALMVHTDGVDFTALEPATLAIALFVAICAGFGAAVAHLVGRAAAVDGWPQARRWWLLGPPLLLLLFPPLLVVAVVATATNHADAVASPDDGRWRAVRIGALLVMLALLVVGAVDLARDTATLT